MSRRSEIGAKMNKRRGAAPTDEEAETTANFNANRKESKLRVDKYDTRKVIDRDV